MAKGTRYTPEFKEKAVRLLTESRGSYPSGIRAIEQVVKDSGSRRRCRAVGATRWTPRSRRRPSSRPRTRWELKSLRAEVAQLGRANETLTTASAFSRRGSTRYGVDGRVRRRIRRSFRDRSDMPNPRRIAGLRVRHASRLPHVQIQACQPHGRQARGAGPRHPSGPLGFLHGRVRVQEDAAQLIAQGWDSAEIGRGRVLSVMRGLDVQGIRRGETPVAAKPARGAGGGPDLVERGSEAEALSRPRVVDIAYVRMANGAFGYVAFVAGVFARGTVGRVCATAMDVRGCHCRRRNGRSRGPHRMAAQTLPGFEGPGAGDVPVGLVVELEASASVIGLRDTGRGGNRVLREPSGASRRHYKSETKIRPYQSAHSCPKTYERPMHQRPQRHTYVRRQPWPRHAVAPIPFILENAPPYRTQKRHIRTSRQTQAGTITGVPDR